MNIENFVGYEVVAYDGWYFKADNRAVVERVLLDEDHLEIEMEDGGEITVKWVEEIKVQRTEYYNHIFDVFIKCGVVNSRHHIRFKKVK